MGKASEIYQSAISKFEKAFGSLERAKWEYGIAFKEWQDGKVFDGFDGVEEEIQEIDHKRLLRECNKRYREKEGILKTLPMLRSRMLKEKSEERVRILEEEAQERINNKLWGI